MPGHALVPILNSSSPFAEQAVNVPELWVDHLIESGSRGVLKQTHTDPNIISEFGDPTKARISDVHFDEFELQRGKVSEPHSGIQVEPIRVSGPNLFAEGEAIFVDLHRVRPVQRWSEVMRARDVFSDPLEVHDPRVGHSIAGWVTHEVNRDGVVLAVNSTLGWFIDPNTLLIDNDRVLFKKAGSRGLGQKRGYEAPDGLYSVFSLDRDRPGIFDIEVRDGQVVGDLPVRNGFGGPRLLRDHRSELDKLVFNPGPYPEFLVFGIKGFPTPASQRAGPRVARSGNDMNWTDADERKSLTAFGYDDAGRLVIVQLRGNSGDPVKRELALRHLIEILQHLSLRDAILGGTSGDVQRYLKGGSPEFLAAGGHAKSDLQKLMTDEQGIRQLGTALLFFDRVEEEAQRQPMRPWQSFVAGFGFGGAGLAVLAGWVLTMRSALQHMPGLFVPLAITAFAVVAITFRFYNWESGRRISWTKALSWTTGILPLLVGVLFLGIAQPVHILRALRGTLPEGQLIEGWDQAGIVDFQHTDTSLDIAFVDPATGALYANVEAISRLPEWLQKSLLSHELAHKRRTLDRLAEGHKPATGFLSRLWEEMAAYFKQAMALEQDMAAPNRPIPVDVIGKMVWDEKLQTPEAFLAPIPQLGVRRAILELARRTAGLFRFNLTDFRPQHHAPPDRPWHRAAQASGHRDLDFPFDPNGFYFGKDRADWEIARLTEVRLAGAAYTLRLNRGPIGRYHSMLVPNEPENQLFRERDAQALVELLGMTEDPNATVCYQSLFAAASQNSKHLHVRFDKFSTFSRGTRVIARENGVVVGILNRAPAWLYRLGKLFGQEHRFQDYPVGTIRLRGANPEELAKALAKLTGELNHRGIPYGLAARRGDVLISPVLNEWDAETGTGPYGYDLPTADFEIGERDEFVSRTEAHMEGILSRVGMAPPKTAQLAQAIIRNGQTLSHTALPTSRMELFGVDLTQAWEETVAAGRIKSKVKHPETGDDIEFGLRLGESGQIDYYGTNLTTGQTFAAPVLSKKEGDNVVNLVGYLRLKPGGGLAPAGGKRILPPHDPKTCSFCSGPISLAKNPQNPEGRKPSATVRPNGRIWNLYYNMGPITRLGHYLMVPDIDDTSNRRPQELIATDIEDLVESSLNSRNLAIVFNSRNAGASQNHIHAQVFARPEPLAVEKQPRKLLGHIGGATLSALPGYEATTLVFEGSAASIRQALWPAIERLQQDGAEIPFDLYLAEGRAYLYVRPLGLEVTPEFPTYILGSPELSGLLNLPTQAVYEDATADRIANAKRHSTRTWDETWELLSPYLKLDNDPSRTPGAPEDGAAPGDDLFPIFDVGLRQHIGYRRRAEVHAQGLWHQGVQAYVVRETESGKLQVLVQQRSDADAVDISKSKYDQSLATQMIKQDGLNIETTLKRGMKTELNVDEKDMQFIQVGQAGWLRVLKKYEEQPDVDNRELISLFLVKVRPEALRAASPKVNSLQWMDWDDYVRRVHEQPERFTKTARFYVVDPVIRQETEKAMRAFLRGEPLEPFPVRRDNFFSYGGRYDVSIVGYHDWSLKLFIFDNQTHRSEAIDDILSFDPYTEEPGSRIIFRFTRRDGTNYLWDDGQIRPTGRRADPFSLVKIEAILKGFDEEVRSLENHADAGSRLALAAMELRIVRNLRFLWSRILAGDVVLADRFALGTGDPMLAAGTDPVTLVDIIGTFDPGHLGHVDALLDAYVHASTAARGQRRVYVGVLDVLGDRAPGPDGESGSVWKPGKTPAVHRHEIVSRMTHLFELLIVASRVGLENPAGYGVENAIRLIELNGLENTARPVMFYLACGSDTFLRWRMAFDRLLRPVRSRMPSVEFRVFVREDPNYPVPAEALQGLSYPVDMPQGHWASGLRSSDLRRGGLWSLLTQAARRYILEHKLYAARAFARAA